jgi:hypothetical protein
MDYHSNQTITGWSFISMECGVMDSIDGKNTGSP